MIYCAVRRHGRFIMERSFAKEVQLLKLGEGKVFEGEGILAVTKAALPARWM